MVHLALSSLSPASGRDEHSRIAQMGFSFLQLEEVCNCTDPISTRPGAILANYVANIAITSIWVLRNTLYQSMILVLAATVREDLSSAPLATPMSIYNYITDTSHLMIPHKAKRNYGLLIKQVAFLRTRLSYSNIIFL